MRLKITTRCPVCGHISQVEYRGMGQSHADWLAGVVIDGKYPDWRCKACGQTVTAHGTAQARSSMTGTRAKIQSASPGCTVLPVLGRCTLGCITGARLA